MESSCRTAVKGTESEADEGLVAANTMDNVQTAPLDGYASKHVEVNFMGPV